MKLTSVLFVVSETFCCCFSGVILLSLLVLLNKCRNSFLLNYLYNHLSAVDFRVNIDILTAKTVLF